MQTGAFITGAAIAVFGTALLHTYSYFGEVPRMWFAAAMTLAMALFALLIAASVWAVRGRKLPDALNDHWRAVMAASPPPLRFLFLFPWVAALLALARTMMTGVSHVMEFHTAWCFGASIMALCFAIGSRRLNPKNPIQPPVPTRGTGT